MAGDGRGFTIKPHGCEIILGQITPAPQVFRDTYPVCGQTRGGSGRERHTPVPDSCEESPGVHIDTRGDNVADLVTPLALARMNLAPHEMTTLHPMGNL